MQIITTTEKVCLLDQKIEQSYVRYAHNKKYIFNQLIKKKLLMELKKQCQKDTTPLFRNKIYALIIKL